MAELLAYGLSFSVVLAALVFSIIAVKKILARRLTAGTHYYIWFLLFVYTLTPFFPEFHAAKAGASDVASQTAGSAASSGAHESVIRDFAVNAGNSLPHAVPFILVSVWLIGLTFFVSRIVYGIIKTRRLFKTARPADETILKQADLHAQVLRLKTPLRIRITSQLNSPVTAGIFRPVILLPPSCGPDLKYIMLHELSHYKHRDTFFNLLMQIVLAVNWFNPAVWLAVRQMATDRETFCDSCVLNLLCPNDRSRYGHAVLSWTAGVPFAAIGIGSTQSQLRQRIRSIAAFRTPGTACKCLSLLIVTILLVMTVALAPSSHGFSASSYAPRNALNIKTEHLDSYFGNFSGSFVLYDRRNDCYSIYNETVSKKRVSPDSTYKIYSGLAALKSRVITPENSLAQWDGNRYPFDQWNRNQNLTSAMQNSVNWYFQALDQQLGKKQLQAFYDKIGYGNCNLSGNLSDYWMESSLKISPLEQVMLLTGLYENKWGFEDSSVSAVKDALLISNENGIIFSGKTGTGMKNNHTINGWFVGTAETCSNLYVFALNLQGKDGATGMKAAHTAQEILEDKGIL